MEEIAMNEEKRLKCTYCGGNITPSSSWAYDEMGYDGDGIVTTYSCMDEICTVDEIMIFQPIKS
jgi:hypothetical protein